MVFLIVMIWPLIHVGLVKNRGWSTWRFFGWGMYATPIIEHISSLRVVILPKPTNVDVVSLHALLNQVSSLNKESQCINIFIENAEQGLLKLPSDGLCRTIDPSNLDYFLYFGSDKHLNKFVKEALSSVRETSSLVYAFLTRQRINLFQRQAYLESDVYQLYDDEVQYLGNIESEGENEFF